MMTPDPDKGCVGEACEGDGMGEFSIFVSLRSLGGELLAGAECKYLPKQDHISFRNVTAWAREHTSGDFRLVVLDAKPPVILNDTEESAYNSLKQLGINIWKSQNQNVLHSDATEVHIDVQLAKEVGVSEVDLPDSCMTELADMWPTGQPAPGSASTTPVRRVPQIHASQVAGGDKLEETG